MKKNKIKKTGIFALICAVAVWFGSAAQNVYAYDYARTGATKGGTVTIQVLSAGNTVNGYILPGGYRVNYSVTSSNWTAFDSSNGCDFYIGNNMKASGGCHFVYAPDGTIWEQGAIALGAIKDGKVVGSCSPDSNGKVKVSFDVSQLSELPEYIAYTYQPAGGAYLHMSESFGHNYHVWYYQKLNTVTPENIGSVDTSAPDISASVTPGGTTATVNGKTWGTNAVIKIAAGDTQSRPGGIRLFLNGGLLYSCGNASNTTSISGQHTVTVNAAYQTDAYDQLGNASNTQSVIVDCIDNGVPSISSFKADKTEYCTELTLKAAASDSGSGLHGTAYAFNDGAWGSANSLTVTENGAYTLRVRDAVGNIATKTYSVENIDKEGPALYAKKEVIGEEIAVGEHKWSKEKKICIDASDEKSGLEKVVVTNASGKEIISKGAEGGMTGELHFETEALPAGSYLITAYDVLGNSTESTVEIGLVDNTPPEIVSVKQTAVNEKTVRITISAKDNEGGSGLPISGAYSFDGGKTWQDSNYKDVDKNAAYELAVRDNMGLQAQTKETVTSIKESDKNDGGNHDNSDKENSDKDKTDKDKNDKDKNDKDKSKDQTPSGGDSGNQTPDAGNSDGEDQGGSLNDGNGSDENQGQKKPSQSKKTTDTEKSSSKTDSIRRNPSNMTISKNTIDENDREDEATFTIDKSFNNKKKEVETISNKAAEAKKTVKRIAAYVLIAILIIGLLGLGAYFLLTYLYHSCVLYAVDDKNNRKRLCRIPIGTYSDDWLVEVPDHKLGTFGNGRYVLVFRTSFVKEADSEHVVITIDRNRIREKLQEEIEINI